MACKTCNQKKLVSAPAPTSTTGDFKYDGEAFECAENAGLDVEVGDTLNVILNKILTELCALQDADGCCVEELDYDTLATMAAGNLLVPNKAYIFEYETIHLVPEETVLNINTVGYSGVSEKLVIKAKTTSTFFHEAKSMDHPEDDILYDFTLNTVSATPRPGLIYYRHDNDNDIEAWFDTRNQVVSRYALNTSGLTYGGGAVDRGEIVYDAVATKLKISIKDGITDIDDFRKIDDIEWLNQHLYSKSNPVQAFGQTIPVNTATGTFHQVFSGACRNIHLASGTNNILFDNCANMIMDEDTVAKSTFIHCIGVSIGFAAGRIVMADCSQIDLDDTAFRVYMFDCDRVKFKQNMRSVIMIKSDDIDCGSTIWNLFIKESNGITVLNNATSIMINRSSSYNIIGAACGGITLGNTVHNKFDSGCTDIQIYSGGHNRFAQGCDTINLLGEQDETLGEGYYGLYTTMAYNTFGVGCSNITFDVIGGRGNQFGDECKNLLFTVIGQAWRLVGCHFVRGIQNKTFQQIIHGCSFLVPDQVTATITTNDWFSPMLYFHDDRDVPDFTSGDPIGKSSKVGSEALRTVSNGIIMGYKSARLPLFNPPTSSGYDLADYGVASTKIIDADTKIINSPNSHAFMWTPEGYPLSMTMLASINRSGDPTPSLNA